MGSEIKQRYGPSIIVPTLTNLHSLDDAQIWLSPQIVADGNLGPGAVQISYSIVMDANSLTGDFLYFYLPRGDDAASEIRIGGASASEGKITSANSLADFKDAHGPPLHVNGIARASQTVKGMFTVADPGLDFQIAIELSNSVSGGKIAASGSVVNYRTLGEYPG